MFMKLQCVLSAQSSLICNESFPCDRLCTFIALVYVRITCACKSNLGVLPLHLRQFCVLLCWCFGLSYQTCFHGSI